MDDMKMFIEKMSEEEKSKTAQVTINKIIKDKSVRHRPTKKFIIIAAALVIILALGAVTIASNIMNLGTIEYESGVLEFNVLENTDQYKAMKEYVETIDAMTESERKDAMDPDYQGTDVEREYTTVGEYDITYEYPDLVNRLCEKYDLKKETHYYNVPKISEMFEKAGKPNFLGIYNGWTKYTAYSYGDRGSILINGPLPGFDLSTGDENYFRIDCYQNNVFKDQVELGLFATEVNEEGEPLKGGEEARYEDGDYSYTMKASEWEFLTKDNYPVKCYRSRQVYDNESIEIDGGWEILGNGAETINIVISVDDYVINISTYDFPFEEDFMFTKEFVKEFVDGFDFKALDSE